MTKAGGASDQVGAGGVQLKAITARWSSCQMQCSDWVNIQWIQDAVVGVDDRQDDDARADELLVQGDESCKRQSGLGLTTNKKHQVCWRG